jgi:hypothetical protein
MTNREKWKFNILFVSENEIHKQETEKWLDDLFSSTSMRRTITGEKGKNVVITYEDTGARGGMSRLRHNDIKRS